MHPTTVTRMFQPTKKMWSPVPVSLFVVDLRFCDFEGGRANVLWLYRRRSIAVRLPHDWIIGELEGENRIWIRRYVFSR